MPPRAVGPYEILSVIGRGGIGTVYRARDRRSGELAALKVLAPAPAIDATAARRLAREFEALQRLEHPHIVRVYEAGVCEGYSFLAMELVEGLDLRSYLSPALDEGPISECNAIPQASPAATLAGAAAGFSLEDWALEPVTDGLLAPVERLRSPGGPEEIRAFADLMAEPETDPSSVPPWVPPAVPPEPEPEPDPELPRPTPALLEALNRPSRVRRMVDAVAQVCEALVYLHGRGFVHRDLKPSNIMVDDHRRARLMDFGLVKSSDESANLTLSGRVVGTYRYMAPEQARGLAVDARADLYSVGVILYELLCGRPPFLAQRPGEMWHDIVEHEPTPILDLNPGADPRLAAISERLLRKDPAARYQDAASLLSALREA